MITPTKLGRFALAFPWLTLTISTVMVAAMLSGLSVELHTHDASTGPTDLLQAATSTMSHFSTPHLLSNLAVIMLFGPLVEYAYGRLCVLAVLATCVVLTPLGVPEGAVYAGASPFAVGLATFAVVGVLKYRATLRARTTKVTMATLAFSMAAVSVPVQIGVDVVNLKNPIEASGLYIAHGSHLLGAVAGVAVALVAALIRLIRTSVTTPAPAGP